MQPHWIRQNVSANVAKQSRVETDRHALRAGKDNVKTFGAFALAEKLLFQKGAFQLEWKYLILVPNTADQR